MIEFETTVRIGRTPAQVFSVLADFETYLAAGLLCRRLQQLIASDLGRLKDLVEAEIPQS